MWDDLLIRQLAAFLGDRPLRLTFAGGRSVSFGAPGPALSVSLHDPDLPRKLLFHPDLALGEPYMDGRLTIEHDDVRGLLDLANAAPGAADAWLLRAMLAIERGWRWFDGINPARRSRRNVAHHYDISPELYGLFLDREKQYTCAYFRAPGLTLDQAQAAKMAHIGGKLLLAPGMRVLDIGCGFGTLAIDLARRHGVHVTGITLSQVQLDEARARAQASGLAAQLDFRLQDYRQVQGPFDRIVSVGMMEHVGRPHLGSYFRKVHDLLTPQGVALIHYIARPGRPQPNAPWFRKYIFPGSYCPALSEVAPHLGRAGLILTDLEAWRGHYDPTLAAWRANFETNADRIRTLTDDRFVRMWRYYLVAAEVSFAQGLLTVHQLQLARTQGAVPASRDYLYSDPARQRRDAGAGDLAQTQGAHQNGEGVDLLGRAGHFEDKAFQR